jgi:hypothetical protein
MASFKGLYDKLMSIIKTDTVVNSGSYSPVSTDIIPVYDYAAAADSSISGEKIAPKKFVRATDLGGGGGGSSTETILYSRLYSQNNTNVGIVDTFTIPANTVPANSMLYFEARAYSTVLTTDAAWGLTFNNDAQSLGQSGVGSKTYTTMIKMTSVNNVSGTNNCVTGPLNTTNPSDYINSGAGVDSSKITIDWSIDQDIQLNLTGTLPAGGVTIQMFRIKLVTQTPTP